MSASTPIKEKAKSQLIEAAKKQYGENIIPCSEPFTEDGDMLFFWFNDISDSPHIKHTHLIHADIVA